MLFLNTKRFGIQFIYHVTRDGLTFWLTLFLSTTIIIVIIIVVIIMMVQMLTLCLSTAAIVIVIIIIVMVKMGDRLSLTFSYSPVSYSPSDRLILNIQPSCDRDRKLYKLLTSCKMAVMNTVC